MKKKIVVFLIYMIPFVGFGYDGWNYMQQDTIDDYSSCKRIFVNMPSNSIKFSTMIIDCEGFVIIYPLLSSNGNVCPLTIDCSVMNNNRLIRTKNVDYELWNTFNRDNVGSRCFIKDGLYNRVDRYKDGYEVYFTDVPQDIFEMANSIIGSIKTKVKTTEDKPIQNNKRKVIDNDSIRYSSPLH